MPNITALARVSGTEGVLTWQPYTLDTSKGFLTKVEVAYQRALTSTNMCPPIESAKVITVAVNQTVYPASSLIAEEEYCFAVRAWTSAGSSGFSTQQILPREYLHGLIVIIKLKLVTNDDFVFAVSNPSLFQVRFQLPPGVFCTEYIVSPSLGTYALVVFYNTLCLRRGVLHQRLLT